MMKTRAKPKPIPERLKVKRHAALMLYLHKRWDLPMADHSLRVAAYAAQLARHMGFPEDFVRRVEVVSIVHDIGKLYVPKSILSKPGKLTNGEWEIIKRHPQDSREILFDMDLFGDMAYLAACHHERWDGHGYPYGLSGQKIPLESRIISIVDAYDAMTSHRPYRRNLKTAEAVEELKRMSGTQFWTAGVEAFVEGFPHLEGGVGA